jgi:LmbE family N-acetylglucosaminyl deacetylase
MHSEVIARMSKSAGVPPMWTSVLAVIAHPDEASIGLGAILDAFVVAGAKVEMLCLTHGQAWTLDEAPGDLAALRGAELASADDVLGPVRAKMQDRPDGCLSEVSQKRLAAEVVAAADSSHPDGLLVFDTTAASGHLDHVAATMAGLLAAETLSLPVLGWNLPESVAAQLSREFGGSVTSGQGEDIDMRVTLDRARQRLVSHADRSRARSRVTRISMSSPWPLVTLPPNSRLSGCWPEDQEDQEGDGSGGSDRHDRGCRPV